MTNKMVPCGYCKTTGRVGSGYGSYGKTTCPVCFGRGRLSVDANANKCQGCNGTGKQNTGYFTCSTAKHEICRGTGWINPQAKRTAHAIACHQ